MVAECIGLKYGPNEDVSSTTMGESGVDVKLTPQARKLYPFSIETKKQETFRLPKWIKQAKDNQLPDTNYQLFITKNRWDWLVVMDAKVWFKLFKEYTRLKNAKNSRRKC